MHCDLAGVPTTIPGLSTSPLARRSRYRVQPPQVPQVFFPTVRQLSVAPLLVPVLFQKKSLRHEADG